MTVITKSEGPCAWLNCATGNCLVLQNAQTGKITRLPSCTQHTKPIAELHTLYKGFAALTTRLVNKISEINKPENLLETYKTIKESIKCEMQGRLKQAESIKPQYRDQGHLEYLKKLFGDLTNVQQKIDSLSLMLQPQLSSNNSVQSSNKAAPAGA